MNRLSNRNIIENDLLTKGFKVGCYDPLLEKASIRSMKRVLECMYEFSIDIQLTIQGVKYVLEINTVDNEKDFNLLTLKEYKSLY